MYVCIVLVLDLMLLIWNFIRLLIEMKLIIVLFESIGRWWMWCWVISVRVEMIVVLGLVVIGGVVIILFMVLFSMVGLWVWSWWIMLCLEKILVILLFCVIGRVLMCLLVSSFMVLWMFVEVL